LLVERIRAAVPAVAISTDVIVGFPGETEAEYQGTRGLLADLRFSIVHVAAYSPRPGTAAARLPDDVPRQVKEQRRQELETLQEQIATELNAGLSGQETQILVEGRHKGRWRGRTPQGRWCFFDDPGDWVGQLARVRVTRTRAWSLQGEVVGRDAPP
jgi:tRNA-2-methylthio-N6-dimethylallyladenosine synthase